MKVLHSEVEAYENLGWIAGTPMKTKTPISRKKEHDRQFEDDVWCMFYNLGFRTLNADDNLRIQWGNNEGEDKQIDILAVGDDAIFVVECKAAEKAKKQSFQQPLNEMELYKKVWLNLYDRCMERTNELSLYSQQEIIVLKKMVMML